MIQLQRPYAVSIAGFDPSGGAGALADSKTFEANGVYGLGVVSALTWQNDIHFEKLEWLVLEKIIDQLRLLQARFCLRYIKIGLIENMTVLLQLITWLREQVPGAVIVWDPVWRASAGFPFHMAIHPELLSELLSAVDCITPNIPEARQLFGDACRPADLCAASRQTAIYLKGGHAVNEGCITDTLYYRQGSQLFSRPRLPKGEKHGSGCVLSSALTARLALGDTLPAAAAAANAYTHHFLASNDQLLGYHFLNHHDGHREENQ